MKQLKTHVEAQHITEDYSLFCGDSCEIVKGIPDNSVDFQIYSPPFSSLYIYSDSYRDMGNNKSDEDFFKQYKFLLKDLYRILVPGRLAAVHCKQLVDYKGSSGQAGLRDFRGEIIRAHEAVGFKYHSEITIWKDPVIEMQRTKSHGLLYKQLRKDSSYSRQGLPDYLVIFRKWADDYIDPKPVDWKTYDNFKLDKWQNYASPVWKSEVSDADERLLQYTNPVWFDVQQTKVLNKKQGTSEKDEKHICPLQLDVIERAVEMWTNPGDVVFTPFAGIGSEIYQSVKMGRRGVGIELKRAYYEAALKNIREALKSTGNMFACAEVAE